MSKYKMLEPAYTIPTDYKLPEIHKEPITRKDYTFDERIMLMLKKWFPDRSDYQLRDAAYSIYLLAGYGPSKGEPTPYMENLITKYLIMYRSSYDPDPR